MKLNRFIKDHEKRVHEIEVILFQKNEEERKGLFESIYATITENEKSRMMEEAKIRHDVSVI
jgi:hypothetical protein